MSERSRAIAHSRALRVALLCLALALAAVAAAFASFGAAAPKQKLTLTIATSSDDARSTDTGAYTSAEASALLGAGTGQQPNVAGYRFNNFNVPPGAIIDSVTFSVVKDSAQQTRLVAELAFESSANAATFSSTASPGSRQRTLNAAHVDTTKDWVAGRGYALGSTTQLAASLQQVVNLPDWQAGGSIALLVSGNPLPANAYADFYTADGGVSRAPTLTVTYHRGTSQTATSAANTSIASTAPTGQGTATATTPLPADTATSLAGAGGGSGTGTSAGERNPSVLVGLGYSDVSPHQLVRTSDDLLYVLVPSCAAYPNCPANTLNVYRANQPGAPTGFSVQDVAHSPTGLGSSASAIDGQNRIHILWLARDGHVNYAIFDTVSNTWGPTTTLALSNWTTFGQGDEGVALALDANGDPHAVWNALGGDGHLHIEYAAAPTAPGTLPSNSTIGRSPPTTMPGIQRSVSRPMGCYGSPGWTDRSTTCPTAQSTCARANRTASGAARLPCLTAR